MASSPSLSLVAVLAIAVLAGTAVDAKNLRNEFIVTYSIIPDPFHTFSFYSMPRNEIQARKMGFTEVQDNWDVDNTSLWCLKNDYRVCVLFDGWGTAAGIQVSASVEDIKNSKLPSVMETELLEDKHEYWIRQKLLGVDVLSTVVYFTPRQVLITGGRGFEYDAPTLFSGYLYIKGRSGILAVSSKEEEAEKSGFTKQGCFFGMGRHYFQELNSTTECENHKPYFMLYDPKEAKLNGFGITAFGKTSINNRSWFEKPPAAVIGMIAPNAPTCLKDWVSTYGLFTIHVYFVKRPWFTMC